MSEVCNREMDATEVLVHAMESFDRDRVKRVVVITLDEDGSTIGLHSNAGSEPELLGLLLMAQDLWGEQST